MTNAFLALIGHGTTGTDRNRRDDVERGIHLRWAFRREMGFPLGCFRLYRRPSNEDVYSLDTQKVPQRQLSISLPKCAHTVTVQAKFESAGRLVIIASAGGIPVGRSVIAGVAGATRARLRVRDNSRPPWTASHYFGVNFTNQYRR